MAKNLEVGEQVLAPVGRIKVISNDPGVELETDDIFLHTTIIDKNDRTVIVDLAPKLAFQGKLPASAVHRQLGVLLIQIGDFKTEFTLLDPLKGTLGNFCRLLGLHVHFKEITIRSQKELAVLWLHERDLISHVILAGHGDEAGVEFGVDGDVDGDKLSKIFADPAFTIDNNHNAPINGPLTPKVFISLCCKTGKAEFARSFSANPICEALIAPFHSVQATLASQFAQNLLAHHFVDGRTLGVAYQRARNATPRGLRFRLWRRGHQVRSDTQEE